MCSYNHFVDFDYSFRLINYWMWVYVWCVCMRERQRQRDREKFVNFATHQVFPNLLFTEHPGDFCSICVQFILLCLNSLSLHFSHYYKESESHVLSLNNVWNRNNVTKFWLDIGVCISIAKDLDWKRIEKVNTFSL
jgi:hypothetical protein